MLPATQSCLFGAKGTSKSNTRSLASPSLASLRFQRESRVYEERVPSHSVFGAEFGGEPASSKSNTHSLSDTPLGSFLYTRPICLLLKTAVGGPILLRQRSLSPIRHGPFLRREADGNRDGKRVMWGGEASFLWPSVQILCLWHDGKS